jgi:hypothetical protein
MRDYQIILMHKAVAPITHMERTEGNEAILRTFPLRWQRQNYEVPYLSGNAMRHVMIREPGWRWLINQYGLAGKLSRKMTDAMLSGGSVSESTRDDNLGRTHRGYEALPLFRMLGGALPDEIIGGRTEAGQALLVCREALPTLRGLLPDGWITNDDEAAGAAEFIKPYQYYRHDATKDHPDRDRAEKDSSMPFGGNCVVPGSVFAQRIVCRDCDEQHIGAVVHAIEQWNGIAGGQKARGHGILSSSYQLMTIGGEAIESGPLIESYEQYAIDHRQQAIDWLFDEAFRETKPEGVADATG